MKLVRVVMLAGLLASMLLGLLPAGSVSAFDQPVDCQGTHINGGMIISGGGTGSSGTVYPADYSRQLLTLYKWAPGDQIRVGGQRPTGTTLEIWLDDEMVASGPYPELTYTVTKRQIAYLTVVMNSTQAEPIYSHSLVITCPL
jgi:hypothetical protein